MMELVAHNNLPSGVVVNHSYVTPKAGQVAGILMNTKDRNIWIYQLLLAVNTYEVELHPWQSHTILHREGTTMKVGFQSIVPSEEERSLQTNQVEADIKENSLRRSHPSFTILWALS